MKGRGNFVNGSKSLKEERKKEIRQEIEKLLQEAAEMGFGREEVLPQTSCGAERQNY